jgi:hypothetical protein
MRTAKQEAARIARINKRTPREELEVYYRTKAKNYEAFVNDMAAFIRFAVENGRDEMIGTTLIHDILGVQREGFDGLFSPRVSGYANRG